MKKIKRIILLLLVIAVALCVYEVKIGYDKYTDALRTKPLDTAVTEVTSKQHYTEYEKIPTVFFNAIVATEDRRFYQHNGFDFIGTTRAVLRDIKEKKLLEGGSTISQQLAKNMYFPQDDTLERKIAEVFMALKIEREYEKNKILELYANDIYYGSGYYCIGDTRCSVRVFERYSFMGKNRVSLNVTLFGSGDTIQLSAITSGGSQAMS